MSSLISEESAYRALADDDERRFVWEGFIADLKETDRQQAALSKEQDVADFRAALAALRPPVSHDSLWGEVRARLVSHSCFGRLDEAERFQAFDAAVADAESEKLNALRREMDDERAKQVQTVFVSPKCGVRRQCHYHLCFASVFVCNYYSYLFVLLL